MAAATIDSATLRQNLQSCLLGKTDRCYTEQLNRPSRLGLRNADSIEEWSQALEKHPLHRPGFTPAAGPCGLRTNHCSTRTNSEIANTDVTQVRLAYEHMDGSCVATWFDHMTILWRT